MTRGARLITRILVLALAGLLLSACAPTTPAAVDGDQVFATAFDQQQSGLQVDGAGTVTLILSDDDEGGRHQRFVVALASGQTLLIAHNIDIAPRVLDLGEGDAIEFKGVYEWNDEGGVVHWTHHDPDGQHENGWIEHDGKVYR